MRMSNIPFSTHNLKFKHWTKCYIHKTAAILGKQVGNKIICNSVIRMFFGLQGK